MREDPLEHRKLEGERGEGGDSLSQNTATARSLPRSRQIACSPPSLQHPLRTHTSLPSAMRQVAQRTRATARYASEFVRDVTPRPREAPREAPRPTTPSDSSHPLFHSCARPMIAITAASTLAGTPPAASQNSRWQTLTASAVISRHSRSFHRQPHACAHRRSCSAEGVPSLTCHPPAHV